MAGQRNRSHNPLWAETASASGNGDRSVQAENTVQEPQGKGCSDGSPVPGARGLGSRACTGTAWHISMATRAPTSLGLLTSQCCTWALPERVKPVSQEGPRRAALSRRLGLDCPPPAAVQRRSCTLKTLGEGEGGAYKRARVRWGREDCLDLDDQETRCGQRD